MATLTVAAGLFLAYSVSASTAVQIGSVIASSGLTAQTAKPWCYDGFTVRNGTMYTLENATLTAIHNAPVYIANAGWHFGMTLSGAVIMSPVSFSGVQIPNTFARASHNSSWMPIFRDIPSRRRAGIGASADFFFIAGGRDPVGSGTESDDVFWANTTTFQTIDGRNMSNPRVSSVVIQRLGSRGLAISGGTRFTHIDIFDGSETWYSVAVGLGEIQFPAVATAGESLYIAGGQYVDTSLGGNGGESLDVWHVSGFPPTSIRLTSLLYGARRSTATILGRTLLVVGGSAYRSGLCCRADDAAPSRIQAIGLDDGTTNVYEGLLPSTWNVATTCSSDVGYTFTDSGEGRTITVTTTANVTTTGEGTAASTTTDGLETSGYIKTVTGFSNLFGLMFVAFVLPE